jgi:predicted GNAT family acetyltransferase
VRSAAAVAAPHRLLTSALTVREAGELLDIWLPEDPELPGANGEPETMQALAAGWRERTGGSARLTRGMAMHRLEQVVEPSRPAAGRLRHADRSERDLMIDWWQAFADEAGAIGGEHAMAMVDARMDLGDLFVWDDRGPVSLVSSAPPVAGVARIGPVYTPPDARRRGYAGMAVAELSRVLLERGAHTCMLFTDLANPTSNKIYAEVGYRRFADWEEHVFEHSASDEPG